MNPQVPHENLTYEHLATLYQVSTWINSSLDFEDALNNVMDAIMQVAKAQRGFLMIHDEEDGSLRVLVARGIDGATIESEGYSTTIVGHVVETREAILTNDAEYDTRFQAGQSIIMRGLRAILCVPMMVQERLIGVVYVDTTMKAGVFKPDDMGLMKAVAGLAARAVENARLYAVAQEKGRLEHELQMAQEIQRNLLPRTMPNTQHYQLAPYWEAARQVAGDFYDAFKLENGNIATVIADVSDKGAPAALFMAVTRTLLRSYATAGWSAFDTVSRTNDLLMEDAEGNGMFVTVFFSIFAPDGHVVHINGGHNPPVMYHAAEQRVEFLPQGGRALAWFPDNPLKQVEMQLSKGDCIVYYTDGLTDAENPQGLPYGEHRLAQAVLANVERDAMGLRDAILEDVARFCAGQAPFDDLTMLVVKYLG